MAEPPDPMQDDGPDEFVLEGGPFDGATLGGAPSMIRSVELEDIDDVTGVAPL